MALTITDRIVRSADTAHTARRGHDGWAVTWLPGGNLTRMQAVAAMEIAEAVGQIAADAGPEPTTGGSGPMWTAQQPRSA